MKTTTKLTFKHLTTVILCMAFTPVLHANPLETVEYAEPQELCFERLAVLYDTNQFTLDYTFTLPPEDIGLEGRIFVGFVFNNEPEQFYLRFRQHNGFFDWVLYNPDVPLDASFVASDLAPVVPLNIVKRPMDLNSVRERGEGRVLVGYGLKNHETDTVSEIFQEMIAEGRYSTVWGTEGRFGTSKVCIETTSYTEKLFAIPVPETNFSENP